MFFFQLRFVGILIVTGICTVNGVVEVALIAAFARVVVAFLAVAVCSKAVCNVGFEGGGQHQLPIVFEVGVAFAARILRTRYAFVQQQGGGGRFAGIAGQYIGHTRYSVRRCAYGREGAVVAA